MKILLSHSWRDKSIATRIDTALKNDLHETWFDIHQLIEGDNIQQVIDVYINKCDIMVLIWSLHSFASDNVLAEIRTAKKLNKRIIPVLTDNTPLEHCAELKGILGVPFKNEEVGMLLLRRALLLLMIPDDMKQSKWFAEAFNNVKELGGYLNYIQNYRLEKNLNEDGNKDEWASIIADLNAKNELIRSKIIPQNNADISDLQQMIASLEKGNNSKRDLEQMLAWCKKNENSGTGLIKKLSEFIQNDIARLDSGGQPVQAIDYKKTQVSIERLTKVIGERKDDTSKKMAEKIKKYSFGLIAEKKLNELVSGCLKYVTNCPATLQKLMEEASLSEYVVVKETLIKVTGYLESQDHGLELRKENLDGFFDDAYIINHAVQLLVKADLVAKNQFSLDFVTMNIADKYISFFIPAATKKKLDASLDEIRALIGLKKNEINWGNVAAIVMNTAMAANGMNLLIPNQATANTNNQNQPDTQQSGQFEDRMAAFSAKYGLGLNPYST